MAKRFTKPSINWTELEKRVSADQRGHYFAFKGKSDGYLKRVLALPPEPPKINWDAYKKTVPVKGLVDKFKKEYDGFKVPFPEDPLTKTIDDEWVKLQADIKEFCAKSQSAIKELEEELKKIEAMPKFEEMTMEMYFKMNPSEAFDIYNPTFWPHNKEEQLGYVSPEEKAAMESEKAGKKK